MKKTLKPDYRVFESQIDRLQHNTGLNATSRKWIPYLYHFSDIKNIVSILREGFILSRSEVTARANFQDIASKDVVKHTPDEWKTYVRFYFRPRTPTLYHNEGFRPIRTRPLNAHCPIPIYLVFDLLPIITHVDAKFSDGNLARNQVKIYTKGSDFQTLPFPLIYHDGPFQATDKDQIIFHRHAEVIFPHKISLEHLRFIWCRSQAEYETLQYLLPPDVKRKWRSHIVEHNTSDPFYRRWLFVDYATLSRDTIQLKFNQPRFAKDRGTFKAHVEITEHTTNQKYVWEDPQYTLPEEGTLILSLSELKHPDDYTVRLELDGNLAYVSRYQDTDIPF